MRTGRRHHGQLACFLFPGHALHEKDLQGQKGDVPLASSQERSALAVPLINRSSTARCVPRLGLHGTSFVRASGGSSRMVVHGSLEGKMVKCILGRPAAVQPCPAPPLPSPHCPARTARTARAARTAAVRRPALSRPWCVRCPGSTDRLVATWMPWCCRNWAEEAPPQVPILSGPKPGHHTDAERRSKVQRGMAGRGRAWRFVAERNGAEQGRAGRRHGAGRRGASRAGDQLTLTISRTESSRLGRIFGSTEL